MSQCRHSREAEGGLPGRIAQMTVTDKQPEHPMTELHVGRQNGGFCQHIGHQAKMRLFLPAETGEDGPELTNSTPLSYLLP